GLGQGQLPPGYVPMTAANGLGRLAAYTRRAASAVAAQLGGRPMPHGPAGSGGGGVPRPAGDAVAAGGGLRPAGPTPDLPAAVATHAAGDSAAPQVAPAAEQAKASTTGSFGAGAGGMALPISFLVLIGGGIGVAAVRARGGRPR
ncbi:MAG TPA: hypothetical protein VG708_03795, partial [Mycobacteriales bacterium]|nr:hypothetical protein [Mycobacteriales bacterium]